MALPAELAHGENAAQTTADLANEAPGPGGTLLSFPGIAAPQILPDAIDVKHPARAPGGWGYLRFKRAGDVVAASVLFVVFLPLFLLIAVLIATTSPGGVFFRQTRVGQGMQPFQCLKFRTMVPDAESILVQDPELARVHALNWKLDNDPRVTRVGRFLRKTSLDELPQLVNVINGEMSLIGPRPYMPKELSGEFGEHAKMITSVRPGMTGLWQVSGRSHLTPQHRILLDREYAAHASLALDMRVAARTVAMVATGRGAF